MTDYNKTVEVKGLSKEEEVVGLRVNYIVKHVIVSWLKTRKYYRQVTPFQAASQR